MVRLYSLLCLPYRLSRRARRTRIGTMLAIVAIVCLLISPFYIIYKPPSILIHYFQYRWPQVLWHISTPSKIIALTIDDGPSEYTEEILRVLKTNDCTATFFVIGSQMDGREEVLQDLISSGNELGNHAMYDEPSRPLSDTVLKEQIGKVERKILDIYASVNTATPPQYFRPGSGFFSLRMLQLLDVLHYRLVLGSIYPHDPQIPYARVNARHILSMLRPGGIIICHDRRSWTVPMLVEVLPEMKRRGYRVVTITQFLLESPT